MAGRPAEAACYGPVVLDSAAYIGFIPVRDPARARTFYEGTLGLRVEEESPFALVVDAHGTRLRITPVGELTVQPFTIGGWEVPDIEAAVRDLTARGVAFNRYDGMEQDEIGIWAAPSGALIAWFKDPDGNTLSLTTFTVTRGF
jgi:catechol 2,3-dioxygenase-like lactoylglutathione lyase family enzyme